MPIDHLIRKIGQIADLVRGDTREKVILPFLLLRRLECLLEPTKAQVLARYEEIKDLESDLEILDQKLNAVSGMCYHNRSYLNLKGLSNNPEDVLIGLLRYTEAFSTNVCIVFEWFDFNQMIKRFHSYGLLHLLVSQLSYLDLSTDTEADMCQLFDEGLPHNDNEGEHSAPKRVSQLMAAILFANEKPYLGRPTQAKKLLDPVCGQGGFLREAQSYFRSHYPEHSLATYGQEIFGGSAAVAAAFALLENDDPSFIRLGDSLANDLFDRNPPNTFDYFLAQPPFGMDWKKFHHVVGEEHHSKGYEGRFGPGLPKIGDSSLLFLLHMIHKFEPFQPEANKFGSRCAIILNESPLFVGSAGSGESEIRRWIIENDWLETIVALPSQLFYNTSIPCFIWVISNRKEQRRKGKIQLIDASFRYERQKNRKVITQVQQSEILAQYSAFEESDTSRIVDNSHFGFSQITVERPLRLRYQMTLKDKARFLDACPHLLDDIQQLDVTLGREAYKDWNEVARLMRDLLASLKTKWKKREHLLFRSVFTQKDPTAAPVQQGKDFEPDVKLCEKWQVPLSQSIEAYFEREIQPFKPDAWVDHEKCRVGYQINFHSHFNTYTPPRQLDQIALELHEAEKAQLQLGAYPTRGFRDQSETLALKNSSILEMGPIPQHWQVVALKNLVSFAKGSSTSPTSGGYVVQLQPANIRGGEVHVPTAGLIQPADPNHLLQQDDLVVKTIGSLQPGSIAIFQGHTQPVSFSSSMLRLRCSKLVIPGYLQLVLNSTYALDWTNSRARGSVIQHLNMSEYGKLPICLPPVREQEQILAATQKKLQRLRDQRVLAERSLALNQELSTALLDAAVTGKIQLEDDT